MVCRPMMPNLTSRPRMLTPVAAATAWARALSLRVIVTSSSRSATSCARPPAPPRMSALVIAGSPCLIGGCRLFRAAVPCDGRTAHRRSHRDRRTRPGRSQAARRAVETAVPRCDSTGGADRGLGFLAQKPGGLSRVPEQRHRDGVALTALSHAAPGPEQALVSLALRTSGHPLGKPIGPGITARQHRRRTYEPATAARRCSRRPLVLPADACRRTMPSIRDQQFSEACG